MGSDSGANIGLFLYESVDCDQFLSLLGNDIFKADPDTLAFTRVRPAVSSLLSDRAYQTLR